MGYSTESDICSNVLYLMGREGDFLSDFYEQSYAEGENEGANESSHGESRFLVGRGWYLAGPGKCGRKSLLYSEKLIKIVNEHIYKVYIVNSSQYARVGEFEWFVLNDLDRASVVLFKKDFSLSGMIEKSESVNQTS